MTPELVDLRGSGCAEVLIRLAGLARTALPDTDLLVMTDDRGAPSELPAWCRMTRNVYVGPVDPEGGPGPGGPLYRLRLNPRPTDNPNNPDNPDNPMEHPK